MEMKSNKYTIGILTLLILLLPVKLSFGAEETNTVISDVTAASKLAGDHFFALQWISWDYYGKVTITTNSNAVWQIKGRQDSREGDDYVTIDGVIKEINTLDFKFIGMIVTKVSHINDGQPSIRSGEMTFRISGKRQYWRLKEMQNPDDGVVDYVDIFFKKYEKHEQAQQGGPGYPPQGVGSSEP